MKQFLILILNLNIILFDNVVFCKQSNIRNTTLIHIGDDGHEKEYMINITDNESKKEYIGLTKTIDGQEIIYFLGIPYAEPPIGTRRFKRPVPYKYETAINATKWQHSCYQWLPFDPIGLSEGITKTLSEDCLYLNIWAPKLIPNQELKAVIVYVHGGGLLFGTSTADVLNGEMISAISDVVIVSMNYRLNVFGFLYSGTPEAPGNVGLWDQVLALEWVRGNIKTFGGDPNRVTLVGSSAGAWSASLHILSPVSRHLFRNVILMSGSPLTHLAGDNPIKGINKWNFFSKLFNCSYGSGINNKKSVNCLREVKAKNLFDTFLSRQDLISDFIGAIPLVVYGNEFLPKKPIESLKSFDFKQNFSLLSGFVDNEGIMFVLRSDLARWMSTEQANFTKKEGFNLLKDYLLRIKTDIPINIENIYQIYLSQLPENNNDLLKQRISTLIGDFYFTCPINLFNKYIYSGEIDDNNVFQYVFAAKPKSTHTWCPQPLGSCHCTDLFMLFGYPLRYPNRSSEEEMLFSKSMINTFAYFAKYDKPPEQGGVEWLSYHYINSTKEIIQPYYHFSINPKSEGNFGFNYKKFECEKIWKPHVENQ